MESRLGNISNQVTFNDVVERVNALQHDSKPLWGTMTPAQMFAHCAEVQEVLNGKALTGTPFLLKLIGPLIKKMVLNDKPYPHNSKTHPQYVQTSPGDFTIEKERLLSSLNRFREMSEDEHLATNHALFGKMSRSDKGRAIYKHIDHHLQQFGV